LLACTHAATRLACCFPVYTSAVLFRPHLLFILRPPQRSRLFPYTTLFRSAAPDAPGAGAPVVIVSGCVVTVQVPDEAMALEDSLDRKSTRLNSSHVSISYAVFCLKKKTRCTSQCVTLVWIEQTSERAVRIA